MIEKVIMHVIPITLNVIFSDRIILIEIKCYHILKR